jgi:hypothetical protein
VLSFFSSRRNWDSPNPHPQGSVPHPPWIRGEGHTRLRERGWESPNSDEGTYTVVLYTYIYVLLWWIMSSPCMSWRCSEHLSAWWTREWWSRTRDPQALEDTCNIKSHENYYSFFVVDIIIRPNWWNMLKRSRSHRLRYGLKSFLRKNPFTKRYATVAVEAS